MSPVQYSVSVQRVDSEHVTSRLWIVTPEVAEAIAAELGVPEATNLIPTHLASGMADAPGVVSLDA